jgi:uncharacterized membrane protein YheB (UPF0754 family)
MERWKQHFYETLNSKADTEKREEVIYQGPEVQTEFPTKNEVWEIIRTLKYNKSPEEDNISAELTKYGDKQLWKDIHVVIGIIWT